MYDLEESHMRIFSDRFGPVDIDDESIIAFPDGIPGFDHLRKFAVVKCMQTEPIQWFQSVEDGHVTLPVINPFLIKPDYSIEIADEDLDIIRTRNEEDLIVLSVMVLPEDLHQMTVNLMAPIVINIKGMIGCQMMMDHGDVPLSLPAFELLMEYYKNAEEVDRSAGSDEKGR
jgi:flagellar assembly factor FliW